MRGQKVILSSLKDEWNTPISIYKQLDDEFHFEFDPCPENPQFNGLEIEWKRSNFVNPPYSQLAKWLEKGYKEWKKNKTVVFLIPSRTDTKAWHEYCMKADEIRFIKGRLKFGGSKNSAPFPSAVVIFKGGNQCQ
jgi:hypothetical protein